MDFADTIISKDLRDLPFIRNQLLISTNYKYIRIFKNIIKTSMMELKKTKIELCELNYVSESWDI
jgi:hypothetical protein